LGANTQKITECPGDEREKESEKGERDWNEENERE